MTVVAVVNPKGGVGKTTLATNLAGYFAAHGRRTMLGDVDRQQSARQWLGLRPSAVAPIESWAVRENGAARRPQGVTHVVLDTPAQIEGTRLGKVLSVADRVIVPLQPSMFDFMAARGFIAELRRRFSDDERFAERVAIVGVRVDARTRSADELLRFVGALGLRMVGSLRDTQNYVQLAAHGLTVFDVPAARLERDRASWDPIVAWAEAA